MIRSQPPPKQRPAASHMPNDKLPPHASPELSGSSESTSRTSADATRERSTGSVLAADSASFDPGKFGAVLISPELRKKILEVELPGLAPEDLRDEFGAAPAGPAPDLASARTEAEEATEDPTLRIRPPERPSPLLDTDTEPGRSRRGPPPRWLVLVVMILGGTLLVMVVLFIFRANRGPRALVPAGPEKAHPVQPLPSISARPVEATHAASIVPPPSGVSAELEAAETRPPPERSAAQQRPPSSRGTSKASQVRNESTRRSTSRTIQDVPAIVPAAPAEAPPKAESIPIPAAADVVPPAASSSSPPKRRVVIKSR